MLYVQMNFDASMNANTIFLILHFQKLLFSQNFQRSTFQLKEFLVERAFASFSYTPKQASEE